MSGLAGWAGSCLACLSLKTPCVGSPAATLPSQPLPCPSARRRYVGTRWKYNKQLADLGLHCYLKMLLKVGYGCIN